MPDAVPLVDKPFMSSVRERAAAFNNAGKFGDFLSHFPLHIEFRCLNKVMKAL